MNNTFNVTRQIRLLRKFWFDNKRAFLLLMLSIAALLATWMVIYVSFEQPSLFKPEYQVMYYFAGLTVSGCLTANFFFADLREKSKRINLLMLPASSLEKVICVLLFSVPLFIIGYTIAFYIVDFPLLTFVNRLYGTEIQPVNIFDFGKYEDPFFHKPANQLFFLYLLFHALFVMGSLLFERYSFFKTVLVVVIISLGRLVLPGMIHSFLPPGNFDQRLTGFEVIDYSGNRLIEMPPWFEILYHFYFSVLIVVLLWLFIYYRFREKQVS